MDPTEIAQCLSSLLTLQYPPIALAFVAQQPEGIAQTRTPVPSACTFWRQAEHGTFYAAAAQHQNCPVGSMVMGFELPLAVKEQLGGLVQSMCDVHYLSMDEASKIPTVPRHSAGIVYGPLAEFPLDPDLVLLWVNSSQAMLYSEAAGRAAWTSAPMEVSGRPGCAALPLALLKNQPGMSLGCAGMRTFTEVSDDLNLAALPASALPGFIDALTATTQANAVMQSFYLERKAAIG